MKKVTKKCITKCSPPKATCKKSVATKEVAAAAPKVKAKIAKEAIPDTSETAGRAVLVLQLVREKKSITMLNLGVAMKLPVPEIGRAVGWLEREGKVSVRREQNGQLAVFISNTIPTY